MVQKLRKIYWYELPLVPLWMNIYSNQCHSVVSGPSFSKCSYLLVLLNMEGNETDKPYSLKGQDMSRLYKQNSIIVYSKIASPATFCGADTVFDKELSNRTWIKWLKIKENRGCNLLTQQRLQGHTFSFVFFSLSLSHRYGTEKGLDSANLNRRI